LVVVCGRPTLEVTGAPRRCSRTGRHVPGASG
jgi:hypothetical protein